jgi:MFS family permease
LEIQNQASLSMLRRAVVAMFFIQGALLANWLSRIPRIQEKFDLSEGELGFVLLGLAVGVLFGLSLVGGFIARFSSRKITLMGITGACISLPLLALAPHPLLLWSVLFILGANTSSMDVAMNVQAVEVEKRRQKPLMSSFHAAFSVGGFVGALLGAAMAELGVAPFAHFLTAGTLCFALMAYTAVGLVDVDGETSGESDSPTFSLPPRGLWALGFVAFCAAVGEGSMGDWSAVYLKNVVSTSAGTAAIGFAAFSLTMTAGRLSGDWLSARFSPATLTQVGGVIAGAGLLLAVLVPETAIVMIGFAGAGIGLSVIIPLAFSVAGNMPGIPPGMGIAGVATIGYAGFLAGPPIIGLVADATSLRVALGGVALLAASLAWSAQSMRQNVVSQASVAPVQN